MTQIKEALKGEKTFPEFFYTLGFHHKAHEKTPKKCSCFISKQYIKPYSLLCPSSSSSFSVVGVCVVEEGENRMKVEQ